jgi:hypothetical protein
MKRSDLENFGIKVTFDLSHNNAVGDLDKETYGTTTPSWSECIDLLNDSTIASYER